MREVVFDTETTGLNAASGDRLVEIGCVELVNRVETGRTYHAYFNPERSMPPEAQAVHGLSEAFLADKPLFGDLVEDLLDFLDDSPLVAHNASFDFAFLNEELSRINRPDIAPARMIDTLALSRTKFPGAKHSLDALCTRFGIDRSHRIKHGALLDAQLLAQVYIELTGGRQIGLGLADAPLAAVSADAGRALTAPRVARPARPHAATPEELERHQAFLTKISDPLWALDRDQEDLAAA
jgi:DNA polymerase-3 subunit epsilon